MKTSKHRKKEKRSKSKRIKQNGRSKSFKKTAAVGEMGISGWINKIKKQITDSTIFKRVVTIWGIFVIWRAKTPQKYLFRALQIIIFLIGLYLVIYPIVPRLRYYLLYQNENSYPYQSELAPAEDTEVEQKSIPAENRLVIPSIHVDMPIVEGSSDKVLDLGVWHRPGTGTPGNANMVLTGHRVGYAFLPDDVKNSTSFYNLDKLQEGDFVILYWGQKEYDYEITGFEIVPPDMMEVESQKVGERLTLYTCHPIGSNAQRLVYYAKRVEANSE